jgi:hypothetical protein
MPAHRAILIEIHTLIMSTIIQRISRTLGIGQIPKTIRRQLQSDGGLLFSFEGIPISVVLNDFRAPGIFCGLRLMSFIGFFAASESRVVASASFFHKVWLNLPYDDPRLHEIAFTPKGRRLSIKFNADGLIPRATGDVTLRLRIPDAFEIARVLKSKGAKIVYG